MSQRRYYANSDGKDSARVMCVSGISSEASQASIRRNRESFDRLFSINQEFSDKDELTQCIVTTSVSFSFNRQRKITEGTQHNNNPTASNGIHKGGRRHQLLP
ncbi:unnamed protein product [Arctogadus glacialis]